LRSPRLITLRSTTSRNYEVISSNRQTREVSGVFAIWRTICAVHFLRRSASLSVSCWVRRANNGMSHGAAMNEFLQAFWSNLCATVLGVVFGLPAAIYINRLLSVAQRRHEATTEANRRDDAIDVLIRSCRWNEKRLEVMRTFARDGRVMRNADLQVTTWDAVGPVLTPICPSPELLQQLSHHWLRLHRLERLNDEVFAREVGTLPPLSDRDMMLGMWGELHDCALSLAAHAREFAEKLTAQKATAKLGRLGRSNEFEHWSVHNVETPPAGDDLSSSIDHAPSSAAGL